jgi:integrase
MPKQKGWRRDFPVPEAQMDFVDAGGGEEWSAPERPVRRRKLPPVSLAVRAQIEKFAARLRAQGQLSDDTIENYSRALVEAVRQAEGLTASTVNDLGDLFEPTILEAVVKADTPVAFVQEALGPGTPRHRRQALRKFLQVCGLSGGGFEEANRCFDAALRAASTRTGSRYVLGVGEKRPRRPRPRREDFERLLAAATATRPTFLAARNRAILLLAVHTGLRRGSIAAIRGEDFSLRPEGLFVSVRLKGRAQRQEREVPAEARAALDRYVERFSATAMARGWQTRIGAGEPGPFWRTQSGGALTSPEVLGALVHDWAKLAGVDFRLHDARHLFAAMLSERLGPDQAAEAGDWSSGVLRKYYSRPTGRWAPAEPMSCPPEDYGDRAADMTPARGGRADG